MVAGREVSVRGTDHPRRTHGLLLDVVVVVVVVLRSYRVPYSNNYPVSNHCRIVFPVHDPEIPETMLESAPAVPIGAKRTTTTTMMMMMMTTLLLLLLFS